MKRANGYWSEERCKSEALKYKTRGEFKKNSASAYNSSRKLKIINEICSHMLIVGDAYKRCIYAYEFLDNSVYIGLTYNTDNRQYRHTMQIDSPVNKKINQNIKYKFKKLTKYVELKEAQRLEEFYVNEYKKNNWIILNSSKTGGLGGITLKWTKEKCKEESLKYNSRKDFRVNSYPAYRVSLKNKWLEEFCSHMLDIRKTNKYWTKERCEKEALKYKNRSEFGVKSRGAYESARKKNILDDICDHMIEIRKPNKYWTKERCKEITLKYTKICDFYKNDQYVYQICNNNKWSNELYSHMK